MDLSTNVKMSDSINELAGALSKAQKDFEPAKFNAENPYFKSKYADLGSIIETAKRPLAENGLSVSQLVSSENLEISVTTLLSHASGQWLSSSVAFLLPQDTKNAIQSAGSIITYLRRYSYAAILGIYAGGDDDGNEGNNEENEKQPSNEQQDKIRQPDRIDRASNPVVPVIKKEYTKEEMVSRILDLENFLTTNKKDGFDVPKNLEGGRMRFLGTIDLDDAEEIPLKGYGVHLNKLYKKALG